MAEAEKSTVEIIEEFKQGRHAKENFDRLWYRYYPRVYQYFRNRKLSQDEGQDLTQEVFIGVYTGLQGLQSAEKFEGWLFQIVVNRYKTYLRQSQRGTRIVPWDAQGHADPVEPGRSPEGSLLDEEKMRAFRIAWQALPEQQRDCLKWCYDENRSYKEIAEIKRIAVETVKAHLKQARKALRRKLGSGFVEDWNEDL